MSATGRSASSGMGFYVPGSCSRWRTAEAEERREAPAWGAALQPLASCVFKCPGLRSIHATKNAPETFSGNCIALHSMFKHSRPAAKKEPCVLSPKEAEVPEHRGIGNVSHSAVLRHFGFLDDSKVEGLLRASRAPRRSPRRQALWSMHPYRVGDIGDFCSAKISRSKGWRV